MNNQGTRNNNQIPITKPPLFGCCLRNVDCCLVFVSWLLVISCLFLLTGCATVYNPATQRNEYYFIDEDAEIGLGGNMAASIIKNNKIASDQKLVSYINDVGGKVSKASDRPDLQYKFYIVSDRFVVWSISSEYSSRYEYWYLVPSPVWVV